MRTPRSLGGNDVVTSVFAISWDEALCFLCFVFSECEISWLILCFSQCRILPGKLARVLVPSC